MKEIVVAGGCFWGVEEFYRRAKGIVSTQVGYAQGHKDNATYQEVCASTTGHTEVVKLTYDENIISLEKVLELLFRIIDPTTLNRQGNDIGPQYRSGVYYFSSEDKDIITEYIAAQQPRYEKKIRVEVEPVGLFVKAEDYHQLYLIKNPGGYCHVNMGLLKPEEKK
ncbi:MAG: peptide-methionine (S)-S-oxide reductase MsrA [Erysipelothrix sp.]|jgi:methionine-S-sulfoxide reductase|nr:peptide-methionine (S)-S-oxide reductase MsrA [Erysipelothrix sp.]